MPSTRRRPETEFEQTQGQLGTQTVTLNGLTGGYNNYTNPELLSPQQWAFPSANIFSGLHGAVRRARWAQILNAAKLNVNFNGFATGTVITDIYGFAPPGAPDSFILLNNGFTNYVPGSLSNNNSPYLYFRYSSNNVSAAFLQFSLNNSSTTNGPYMRFAGTANMIFQTNGQVRFKLVYDSLDIVFDAELWGIDAPDVSPSIALSAGQSVTTSAISRTSGIVTYTATGALGSDYVPGAWVVIAGVTDASYNSPAGTAFQILTAATPSFTYAQTGVNSSSSGGTAKIGITKTVGRSYQYAWENANTGHVSAPSPASQYVAYSNQVGTIDCIESGTVSMTSGLPNVTGTNTNFTSAWIGRYIWIQNFTASGDQTSAFSLISPISVSSATSMVLNANAPQNIVNQPFAIIDAQATHVRLYATGDGGSTYLRIARRGINNSFSLGNHAYLSPANKGLEFVDTDAGEPPNDSFSNELAQIQNVPPPVGSFLQDYQGRILVYGVPGALQSFFYSNIESTVVGQPPESFAPLNQVTLPVGEAQLNGAANLPTGLIFWSSKQDMFKLTGTLSDNTVANAQQLGATIQRLPYKIGCASPYAMTVTSLGAFWFSSDREVWLFTDHYAPKNVGKPIQDLLNQASRIGFAKMKNYKSGDRNWLALAITTNGGSVNNTLCLLDLDLLASNGQPSFFTFDMATNQPSWYVYNTNCESIESAFDSASTNHLLAGDVDKITDLDWQSNYYTVASELSVPSPQLTLHAVGNQDPELIKTARWLRATTNQLPKNLASQGWSWAVLCTDDDKYMLGINPQIVQLVPGVDSPSQVFALEYSPAVFRFGGVKPVKGRRFQIQTTFPSGPGFYELRGFQFSYDQVVER